MSVEYKVKIEDYLRNIVIEEELFTDANTAYNFYRRMQDEYSHWEGVQVNLIEPN